MEILHSEIRKIFNSKFSVKPFISGESSVPVSGKVFDEKELVMMVEAVMDGWWTEGKYAAKFEKKLANFFGLKFCAAVNSGSSANLLAISALTSFRLSDEKRLKKGDEIITVAAGFPTTINPIIQNGLVPVFVDVALGNYNASLENIKKAITKKTKAVFIAHTLGNPSEVAELRKLCDKNKLWLIEDNCDALGSMYEGQLTGTFGHISTCSFYPAHHITMAEGGAVLTNDPVLSKVIRSLRDWGRDCVCPTGVDNFCRNRFGWKLGDLPQGYDHKYIYSEIGYNLKITDIQASLGLAQLDKLPGFIQKRKDNFSYLYSAFRKMDKYFILPEWSSKADPSWFGFLLTIRHGAGFSREDLLRYLNDKKIGVRLLFAGNITKQPYFKNYDIDYRISGDLKNTDEIMKNTFWIGVYPGLNKAMLDYVVKSFEEFLETVN
ncbi:MAG: lipopolysaccharide biosynthesis protein RfbH [Parcubacteria group bacterium]|jgi:CDP-6-deoxy-D-xylo-4-hexulose-3-dehydrase